MVGYDWHTARTKPQFATGPQKWVVLGPTGLLRKALSAVDMANDFSKDSPHLITRHLHQFIFITIN